MTRWVPFILLVLTAALLEGGNGLNLMALGQWHIRPAPLVVLLVFYAMHCRAHDAVIAAFIIGVAMDMTGSQMGPHTISYCLAGGLLNQLSEQLVPRRITHQALLILLTFLAVAIIAYWLDALKTGQRQAYAYRIFLLTGLYTACIGPFFWQFLRRVNRSMTAKATLNEPQRGYLR